MGRKMAAVTVGFIIAWYAGAMVNFFPFSIAGDLTVNAIAYTGLLVCVVMVLCVGWIVEEIHRAGADREGGKDRDASRMGGDVPGGEERAE